MHDEHGSGHDKHTGRKDCGPACRLSGANRCQHLWKSPLVNAETSSLLRNKLENPISVGRAHLQWCFPRHSQQASHSLAVLWGRILRKGWLRLNRLPFLQSTPSTAAKIDKGLSALTFQLTWQICGVLLEVSVGTGGSQRPERTSLACELPRLPLHSAPGSSSVLA